jgi:predicted RNase H-like nuclease (RuvC/YqgF family)
VSCNLFFIFILNKKLKKYIFPKKKKKNKRRKKKDKQIMIIKAIEEYPLEKRRVGAKL